MKLSKIIDKVKKYLKKEDLKKSQEEKVLKIIEDLKEKRAKIKEEIKALDIKEIKKKEELEKKLQAIAKLIKKSEKVI
ncbi:hypothetical protein ACN2EN_06110 [Aliarcobacter lanthieri]|uniref:hypothetical protein n=1 Tax=Aliarcobacter lanthieri TaxID=1355374 RepID=UPI00047E660C|nr:hypothetical protein [Aliarcobacter lanthieri]